MESPDDDEAIVSVKTAEIFKPPFRIGSQPAVHPAV
jgi:hypothetical protein